MTGTNRPNNNTLTPFVVGCAVDNSASNEEPGFGSRPLSSVWDSTPDPAGHVVVGVCGWCVPVIRVGGYSGGVTPGPIPNPEAKPTCADGTAPGRVWESRSLPANNVCEGVSFVAACPVVGLVVAGETPSLFLLCVVCGCCCGVGGGHSPRVRGGVFMALFV